ncbi:hypothetical protein K438DRAFT_1777325 [Mycena galopus ATCC 62051]|nr:hypothetical protein K438DRAFT_1777325 [Mycena galopus ATCC 62051]
MADREITRCHILGLYYLEESENLESKVNKQSIRVQFIEWYLAIKNAPGDAVNTNFGPDEPSADVSDTNSGACSDKVFMRNRMEGVGRELVYRLKSNNPKHILYWLPTRLNHPSSFAAASLQLEAIALSPTTPLGNIPWRRRRQKRTQMQWPTAWARVERGTLT